MVINILITFWFWRTRGTWAHLGLPEAQCSHTQVEAVCLTDPHTAFEIASHLFLYLQNTSHKMSVRFVVSRVTSRTRFCLQASLAFQTSLLVKILQVLSVVHQMSAPSVLEGEFWDNSLQTKSLWFRDKCYTTYSASLGAYLKDLDASCPHATVKIHFSYCSGMYYQWTLLACNPACEKLSSVCVSNPLWRFVPSTFLLDHGKWMFAEGCLTLLYCLGLNLKIGALMLGWRTCECSVGAMGFWKNSCLFKFYNSEIQVLELFG